MLFYKGSGTKIKFVPLPFGFRLKLMLILCFALCFLAFNCESVVAPQNVMLKGKQRFLGVKNCKILNVFEDICKMYYMM